MHRRFATICTAFFIAWTLAGCQPADREPEAEARPTEAEDLAAIEAQARAFSAAYVSDDTDALVAMYTEDGMAAPSNQGFIVGHDALRTFWAPSTPGRLAEHATEADVLVIDGDHAYDWGHYRGVGVRDDGSRSSFAGKYVIVWERGADGVWRIAADMWNSLPPPPPPPTS